MPLPKQKWKRSNLHRITDANVETKIGTCATCGPNTPIDVHSQKPERRPTFGCKIWRRQRQATTRSSPEFDKWFQKKCSLKFHYDLEHEESEALFETFNKTGCFICGKQSDRPSVDHCHYTKSIRGVLCPRCNQGLGYFSDDPDLFRKAAKYLENVDSWIAKPNMRQKKKREPQSHWFSDAKYIRKPRT